MITTRTVLLVLLAEVTALSLALTLLIGHGSYLAFRTRRLAPRRSAVRRALHEAVAADRPERAADVLRANLSATEQANLLAEVAPNLVGASGAVITRIAADAGLLDRAEALCASRRWRQRLRGVRLFTLFGGGTDAVPRLFDDPRPQVRAQAAQWAAGQPLDEQVIARLIQLLGDDYLLCRFTVEDSLTRLGRAAAGPLAEQLRTSRGNPARRVLRIGMTVADVRMLEPTLAHCGDPEPDVRAAAATLLGALGGARAAEALESLAGDPVAEVRAAAATSLGRLQHWTAAPEIADLLSDESWDVRWAAGMALRHLGGVGTLLLRRSLADADEFARDMARHVLDMPGADAGLTDEG